MKLPQQGKGNTEHTTITNSSDLGELPSSNRAFHIKVSSSHIEKLGDESQVR